MDNYYEKIKKLTVEDIITLLAEYNQEYENEKKSDEISANLFRYLYANKEVNYIELTKMLPIMKSEDVSRILSYDRDYSISFLVSAAPYAEEEDMTRQAIFLLRRHGLEYIRPLLEYCDEDEIREVFLKIIQAKPNN